MTQVIITKLPPVPSVDPIQSVATNLQYTVGGVLVTSLVQSQYVPVIGNALSTLMGQFNTLSSNFNTLLNNFNDLDIPAAYTPPTVVASGVMGDSNAHPFQNVISATATQFWALQQATGTPSNLTAAIGTQPSGLAASNALSVSGVMSGISGWVSSPTLASDTIKNLWLTIEDMRAATVALQAKTAITCSSIIVDFLPVLSSNGRTATLYFQGYSFIPSGFSDTGSGATLTVTDVDGNSYTHTINVTTASTGSPITIDLTQTALLPTSNYTFSLASSITNSTLTCAKITVHTVINTATSCPIVTVNPTSTTAVLYFTPPITDNVVYTLTLLDSTGQSTIASTTVTNPIGLVTYTFSGLTASTTYKLRVTTAITSLPPTICPLVTVVTSAAQS